MAARAKHDVLGSQECTSCNVYMDGPIVCDGSRITIAAGQMFSDPDSSSASVDSELIAAFHERTLVVMYTRRV